jgi:hypothetical protein
MTFRDLATLERWVAEFEELGYPIDGHVRVVPQDGDDGADTGLVAASLRSVSTVLYIQPKQVGSAEWCVTFEPRDSAASMDAATVLAMANELAAISTLCSFLQGKASSAAR